MQRKINSESIPYPIRRARQLLRQNRSAVRAMLAVRAARDERMYRAVAERYAAAAPSWREWPDELERQRQALQRVWQGPARAHDRADTVHLFIATNEMDLSFSMSDELQRSFDADVYNFFDDLPAPKEARTSAWRARLQGEILGAFREAYARRPVDLALMYVNAFECEPATLRAIRDTGVPVAVLSWDDKRAFESDRDGGGQKPLLGSATVHLSSSRECLRWYTAEGVATYFLPEGADPELYRPMDVEKDIDVSFVGGWYGQRRELIARLRADGIAVRCWGPASEGGSVSRDEAVRIFNRSRINLGFGGVGHMNRLTQLKTRDFEIPMTGNLYLTLYNPELADQFAIGSEILCYLNDLDCAEQIRFWLGQPERAQAIGRAARARSLRCHTWTRRLSDLLIWMGILRPSTPPDI